MGENLCQNGLIEFKKSSDDICRYYNGFNRDLSFPGMNPGESAQWDKERHWQLWVREAMQDTSADAGGDPEDFGSQTEKEDLEGYFAWSLPDFLVPEAG